MLNITQEVEGIMRRGIEHTTFMSKPRRLMGWLLISSILPMVAQANSAADELRDTLRVNGQAMPVDDVRETPMEGIYYVRLDNGETFYSNADGSHFLVGDLYENADSGLVNLTEQSRNQERADAIAAIPESDRVIFRGEETPKATIVVFTDPSCPYCAKLHETVPELNERGVAVHYLAFPRSGMNADAGRTLQRVWCADNPSEAMSRAKRGETLPSSGNCDNPVAEQYELGRTLGVQGTPAIILPNGRMVPGFVPPDRMMQMLELNDA
ncbi:DsbC family protein [Vreelandella arcis]|uniref:Thiol:disulfide interchange protein n=1 Tax=Vreelandella arcis TaxID=416873 RepID=A0A1H0BXT8_9GAMM|nr:DsbC family protein [Halomonas arcis]SDN50385.1 thiol:disulfide interchange protein DsbC [Halomonas arcis]